MAKLGGEESVHRDALSDHAPACLLLARAPVEPHAAPHAREVALGPCGELVRPPHLAASPTVFKCLGLMAVIGLLCWSVFGIATHIRDNFHTVARHRAYRGGQLSPSSLESRIAIHRLQSVVNLRGPNPHCDWYREEIATARRLGVEHYDVPLCSQTPPSSGELRELVRILDVCAKPVFLHCESGSDRTGQAATIFLLLHDNYTIDDAWRQMGIRYGSLPGATGTERFRAFLAQYEDWLAQQGQSHRSDLFRQWTCTVYVRTDALGAPDYPYPARAAYLPPIFMRQSAKTVASLSETQRESPPRQRKGKKP